MIYMIGMYFEITLLFLASAIMRRLLPFCETQKLFNLLNNIWLEQKDVDSVVLLLFAFHRVALKKMFSLQKLDRSMILA